MQTEHAIKLAGSATALAEILGITLSAISQWDIHVPELRVYKLRELKPDWFVSPELATQKQSVKGINKSV